MKAQTADTSASFERQAARSSTVTRSVIAFVGSDRRFIVVQGVVLFMVFLVIVVNLIVDILYTVLDPRIRYS